MRQDFAGYLGYVLIGFQRQDLEFGLQFELAEGQTGVAAIAAYLQHVQYFFSLCDACEQLAFLGAKVRHPILQTELVNEFDRLRYVVFVAVLLQVAQQGRLYVLQTLLWEPILHRRSPPDLLALLEQCLAERTPETGLLQHRLGQSTR